jgi:electron transport complex protein RnfG
MRKLMVLCLLAVSVAAMAQEKKQEEPVMTKEKGGVYIINTTTICDTKGYKSPTPLKVTVKKDKIESVEALPNMETPKYFRRINEELLPKFVGLKSEECEKVDALTGATMSSNAVKANLKAAFEYYKAKK